MYLLVRFSLLCALLSPSKSWSLPIDWNGFFGVDYTHINNFRRTSDDITKDPAAKSGTQGIADGKNGASFQTYLFKLNPHIIINDGVSLKGEISTGHIRGGFMGDNSTNTANGTDGNNSYFSTTPANRTGLNLNQIYAEIYADTALIKAGRFSRDYGMGAILNGGNNSWDRFFTMYDGIQAEMKIGNFSLIPSYAKLSAFNDTNNRPEPAGNYDVRETSVEAKYDNKSKDFIVSVLFAKRFAEAQNSLYNSTDTTSDFNRGSSEVTLIDLYISKKWKKFHFLFEMPMFSGDYGRIYNNTDKSKIASRAILFKTDYELSQRWQTGLFLGQVDGDKGDTDKFEGTYLNPNFHIAELMFRYHYPSFNEGQKSIFDSSISNTRFLKYHLNYLTDKWTWKAALVWAKAQETASAGKRAYHHEENYSFQANETQKDDLGYEFDIGFDYRWSPGLTISGYYGFWIVGDYYKFSNTTTAISTTNVHGGGLRASIDF